MTSHKIPSSLPQGTVIIDTRGKPYLQTSTGIRKLDRSTALAIAARDEAVRQTVKLRRTVWVLLAAATAALVILAR